MLGMFSILRGDFHENDSEGRDAFPGRPKCAEVCLGYSRDGFHWHRPTHETFAGISERRGDWNWGNVQPAGNSFLVVGDSLYFYVSGRRGAPEFQEQNTALFNSAYAGCLTGLAILRRDGFASMNTALGKAGTLTTRPLQFRGRHLFVNANSHDGELRVEVLDQKGNVIAPFSKENCQRVESNSTRQAVTWDGADDLSSLAGKPVRFRFHLENGQLYSFWVSDTPAGASNGYVAGGGPGFTTHRDSVGAGYQPENRPPLAHVAMKQTVRDVDGDGAERVTVNAAGTVDHDGLIIDHKWSVNGRPIRLGRSRSINLPVGRHEFLLSAIDDDDATGYAGTTITVLPKTDPVPPRDGLVMWLKADSLKMSDGSPVAEWKDSSPNSYDTAQPETKRKPIFVKKAIGNSPAVRFDGSDDHLVVDHTPGLLFTFAKSTIIAVVRPDSGGTIVSQAHTNLHVSPGADSRLSYGSSFPVAGGQYEWPQIRSAKGGVLPVGQPAVCSMVHSGDQPGETALFVNGLRSDSGAAFPYHRTSAILPYVGCAYRQRSPFRGDIAELLIYSRALTVNERSAVEEALRQKYGLPRPTE